MKPLTDHCSMPFGKYKGEKMANVPASYLIYLNTLDDLHPGVKAYIQENLDALNEEVKR